MSQIIPVEVELNIAESVNQFALGVSEDSVQVAFSLDTQIVTSTVPDYDGPYEFTPSPELQTIETNGFRMTDNVTINPIPSNYGLITWNGSILTVS